MKTETGQVYLVGAGCGEADLITLRGLRLLQECDVVVYDDLIAEELLDAAPPAAERLYVGKRSGRHSASQQEICALLIEKAREGKTVVRLKGGDPFVFGRGGEELLALREAGIAYEEVPGISSAIAIPAAAGIPVTHRGMSRSVHIVTAHTADTPDGLPEYLDALAPLPGTLVFLMGLAKLPQIAARLIRAGKSPDTPAAVLSGGNSSHPMSVRATLATIAAKTKEAGVSAPAVIVVGAVAELTLSATVERPLRGMTVALTGTARMTEKLSALLQRAGARCFVAQRSELSVLPFSVDVEALNDGRTHWLVFTSPNGVQVFFDRLAEQRSDLRALHNCRLATIGQGTAQALERRGVYPALCPAVYNSEALVQELCGTVRGGEDILLYRSAFGSPLLYERLRERFPVRDIPTYTLRASELSPELGQADHLVFCSAGGVEAFFHAGGTVSKKTRCVCIGEVTAAALHRRGVEQFQIADTATAEGVVDAICLSKCLSDLQN